MPSQGRQKHEPTTRGAHCISCLVVSVGCGAVEDIRAFETGGEAMREIGKRLSYFNTERPHSQHGILTPNELLRGKHVEHRARDAGFKARLAPQTLEGERTVSDLASEYGVQPSIMIFIATIESDQQGQRVA